MRVTHASLFSGIGGFDLAAEWMGWENVFQVEIDPFCNKVLEKNFPNAKRYGDIKQFSRVNRTHTQDLENRRKPSCKNVNCSPIWFAVKDERHLWPEMLRVIGEVKPTYVIGENVSGIFNLVDEICSDLEGEGYTIEPVGIEAGCIGTEAVIVDTLGNPFLQFEERFGEPAIFGEYDGLPKRLDVCNRLTAIGNAIDPRVVFEIFKALNV